jgi:hypothetical protein
LSSRYKNWEDNGRDEKLQVMRIINVNGRDITILQEEATPFRYYNKKQRCYEFKKRKKILCWFCNKPKLAYPSCILKGIGLVHIKCGAIVRANKQERRLPIPRIVNHVRVDLLNSKNCKKFGGLKLSDEDIQQLIFANCYYCGAKPKHKFSDIDIWYNGIDRVSSKKGYEMNNCVPCCHTCNRAKMHMTLNRFMFWIDKIAKFNGYRKDYTNQII